MTDAQQNNHDESIAALLRLAADDDLTPEQQARLDAYLAENPEDLARIDFDRQLRGACARAMSDVSTPEGLADRVRAAIAEDAQAEALSNLQPQTTNTAFWSRARDWRTAAAAIILLALVLGGAWNLTRAPAPPAWAELAGLMVSEHSRTYSASPVSGSMELVEVERACDLWLGCEPSLDTLLKNAKVELADAHNCVIGGRHTTAHLQIRLEGRPEGNVVSLFIMTIAAVPGLSERKTYKVDCPDADAILVWRAGELVYFLVSDAPGGCDALRAAIQLPQPQDSL